MKQCKVKGKKDSYFYRMSSTQAKVMFCTLFIDGSTINNLNFSNTAENVCVIHELFDVKVLLRRCLVHSYFQNAQLSLMTND